jgi:hypothetical protein
MGVEAASAGVGLRGAGSASPGFGGGGGFFRNTTVLDRRSFSLFLSGVGGLGTAWLWAAAGAAGGGE